MATRYDVFFFKHVVVVVVVVVVVDDGDCTYQPALFFSDCFSPFEINSCLAFP